MTTFTTLGLAGCFHDGQTLPVNLDFSQTNYGFINSGGYQAGAFFAWDTERNQLEFLGDVPGFEPPTTNRRRDVRAKYASGVDLGVELDVAAEIAANSWIRRNSSFRIENGARVPYNNVYTKISAFLSEDQRRGGSIGEEWGIEEAISNPNKRFVILRDVTFGDAISLDIDAEAGANGGLKVPFRDGDVHFEITGRGLEDIRGKNIEIAFMVYVLEPYWLKKDGAQTWAFRRVRNVDTSDLPKLLRNAGSTSQNAFR
jgi:hypothetical protein